MAFLDLILPLLEKLDLRTALYGIGSAWLIHRILLIIYRVYFHPLRHVPGPFLAKCTILYRTYYDVTCCSTPHFHDVLVPKYGNCVRIAPNAIRIKDREAYYTIHATRNGWLKDNEFYDTIPADAMSVMTDHHRHNIKRKAMDPLFSKASVQRNYETLVHRLVNRMLTLFHDEIESKPEKKVKVDLAHAIGSCMGEISAHASFGQSLGMLEKDTFLCNDIVLADAATWRALMCFRLMPWLDDFIKMIPQSWLTALDPAAGAFPEISKIVETEVARVIRERAEGKTQAHPTSLWTLMDNGPNKGTTAKERKELADDSVSLFMAGFHTSAFAIVVGLYYLAKNKEIVAELRKELKAAHETHGPELSFKVLEQLPYLTGVVKESLRLSFGVAGPLPRVVPSSGATTGGFSIPGGTIVDMDSVFILTDPAIYSSPDEFLPNRWNPATTSPEQLQLQDKFMVAFSRGPYNCIGQYLAVLEMYVAIAAVSERWEWELDEELTKEEKFIWGDAFITMKLGAPLKFYIRER